MYVGTAEFLTCFVNTPTHDSSVAESDRETAAWYVRTYLTSSGHLAIANAVRTHCWDSRDASSICALDLQSAGHC